MKRWYLTFDGRCSTCRTLAALVLGVAADRITLLDLHEELATRLLRRVYPAGWRHAPYVIVVGPSGIMAWTGFVGLVRLCWRLGPSRSWALLRAAQHAKIALLPPLLRTRRHG